VVDVAFQQIESEEAMDNGTPSIRLFGVTDVLASTRMRLMVGWQ
jgi:hypothetical protein